MARANWTGPKPSGHNGQQDLQKSILDGILQDPWNSLILLDPGKGRARGTQGASPRFGGLVPKPGTRGPGTRGQGPGSGTREKGPVTRDQTRILRSLGNSYLDIRAFWAWDQHWYPTLGCSFDLEALWAPQGALKTWALWRLGTKVVDLLYLSLTHHKFLPGDHVLATLLYASQ